MHVVKTFLRWTYLRAVFHRGYVLTPGLYFVVDAHLSASQIVLLGTVVSATLALADIPTGVWADAIGRKWPLVIGHLFLAAGMVMTDRRGRWGQPPNANVCVGIDAERFLRLYMERLTGGS